MVSDLLRIGTADWGIPKQFGQEFPPGGSRLERYARRLAAVEINSSFYRPHRPATYARWAASVPADFRFAVKAPREITHVRKLVATTDSLERFLSEIRALGDALGPVLLQFPPSFRFDEALVARFLESFRLRFDGATVCEPRHPSWFTDSVDAMLIRFRIARVAADPAAVPPASVPGGWKDIVYYRLHGSPTMYYSGYPKAVIDRMAGVMREAIADRREAWCIFDNTALGEATRNALELSAQVATGTTCRSAG